MLAELPRDVAVRAVVIELRLPLAAGGLRVDDTRQHVRAGEVDVGAIGESARAAVHVALQRERVPFRWILAVEAKAGLAAAKLVARAGAVGGEGQRAEIAELS